MGLVIQYADGQTPLDEDEKEGLLVHSITTREALDELEQRNIEEAIRWTITRRKRFTQSEILTEDFMRALHRRMFGNVWMWAGDFRNTNKNIGVDKYQIGIELRILLDDCRFWIEHKTYADEEIAIRFKHRIVSIHCFSNGNGRHSRLMGDVIIEKIFRQDVFTWGGRNLVENGDIRTNYLSALRNADKGDFFSLIKFARS
jgi:Fic-DOC domain mobile mystery protein B